MTLYTRTLAGFTRRELLKIAWYLGAAAVAAPLITRRALAKPIFDAYPFTLGVASGDPTPDGVVLWTRLAPQPLTGGGMDDEARAVRYEIAADESFRRIVRRGAASALPEEAHTVHAEVSGLQPDTWYWYRFKFGPDASPPGRTRTAPALGASPEALSFAFVSCQNYAHGYYPAFADLAAQEDLALVVHLGDYIYEGNGVSAIAVRPHVPRATLVSLSDYRTRYAQYRTDRDLQAAHAACPWLLTWDDHEVANNYANLDFDPDLPLDVAIARRAAAYQAY